MSEQFEVGDLVISRETPANAARAGYSPADCAMLVMEIRNGEPHSIECQPLRPALFGPGPRWFREWELAKLRPSDLKHGPKFMGSCDRGCLKCELEERELEQTRTPFHRVATTIITTAAVPIPATVTTTHVNGCTIESMWVSNGTENDKAIAAWSTAVPFPPPATIAVNPHAFIEGNDGGLECAVCGLRSSSAHLMKRRDMKAGQRFMSTTSHTGRSQWVPMIVVDAETTVPQDASASLPAVLPWIEFPEKEFALLPDANPVSARESARAKWRTTPDAPHPMDLTNDELHATYGQGLADELIQVRAQEWTTGQWVEFRRAADGGVFRTMDEVRALVRRVAAWPPTTALPVPVTVMTPPPDPLDVTYDGVTLRELLAWERAASHEERSADGSPALARRMFRTPAQRAAVSDHWSAELRAKMAASAERERCAVVLEQDAEDLPPWGGK